MLIRDSFQQTVLFSLFICSSNFLKLDVYYASLQSTTVIQARAYEILVFLGNANIHFRWKKSGKIYHTYIGLRFAFYACIDCFVRLQQKYVWRHIRADTGVPVATKKHICSRHQVLTTSMTQVG